MSPDKFDLPPGGVIVGVLRRVKKLLAKEYIVEIGRLEHVAQSVKDEAFEWRKIAQYYRENLETCLERCRHLEKTQSQ